MRWRHRGSCALWLLLFLLCQCEALSCTPGGDCRFVNVSVNTYWEGQEANGTLLQLTLLQNEAAPVKDSVLLIIQIQGGSINSSSTNAYGSNNSTGKGFTDVGSAGLYEFARVSTDQIAGSGRVRLVTPLKNNYTSVKNNRFQVILVNPEATQTVVLHAFCKRRVLNHPARFPAYCTSTAHGFDDDF